MVEVVDFEPGAAPTLFVVITDDTTGDPIPADALMISVSIGAACFPLVGVYDPVREGFAVDLNVLEPDVEPRVSYNAYIYADFGEGWVRASAIKLRTLVGCVWQP